MGPAVVGFTEGPPSTVASDSCNDVVEGVTDVSAPDVVVEIGSLVSSVAVVATWSTLAATIGGPSVKPTTAGPIEASGEEPAVTNIVPIVAANVDQVATTATEETSEPISTTTSGAETSVTPSTTSLQESLATVEGGPSVKPTTAGPIEASGEEPAVTNIVPIVAANVDQEDPQWKPTTAGPIEASGEEPAVTNKVPIVAANVDQEDPQWKPTTAGPIEASGEEPAVSNKVPIVAANVDQVATTAAEGASEATSTTPSGAETSVTPSATSLPESHATVEGGPSVEPTTAGPIEASGEEPAVSNKVPIVAANVDQVATTAAEGASEATSTTPSGAETSVTPSATSLPESPATEAGEGTTVEGGPSVEPTTAGPIEASGEEPAVSNKVPIVAANVDQVATTAAEGASEATSTTPSGAETSVTPSATSLPESHATVEGGPSVEPTTAGPIEASGEEPAVSNKVPIVAANVDQVATTAAEGASEATSTTPFVAGESVTPSATTLPESHATVEGGPSVEPTTAGPIEASGEEPASEPSFVTSPSGETGSPTLSELYTSTSSSLGVTTISQSKLNETALEDDEDDSIINPTILEQPHKADLPVNVGFVPGSEPEAVHESGEQEEEETEKTGATKEPDYEDAIKAKTLASEPTTEGTPNQSTSTEPPVQLVKDLIDALAGGGLNAVLGTPRPPLTEEEADRRLVPFQKKNRNSLRNATWPSE
ncbi:hypothetical protein COOONC_09375 [Cooperia oncophora]